MIRFGTSGWRGIISDDFNFQNVRRVAHTLSRYVKENPEFGFSSSDYHAVVGESKAAVPVVVIGYDTRFLSEEFAHEAAAVLASDGVKAIVSKGDLPTPAVCHAVRTRKAVGGIMITASHNPGPYNGLKWMPFWGGAAIPTITDDIERRLELLGNHPIRTMALDRSLKESWIVEEDFRPEYFERLASLLDVKAIRAARLKIGVDAMHGSARHYLRPFLEKIGLEVVGLHEERDVLFGGRAPEPCPESLPELKAAMSRHRLSLGLACDGDGDRFGVLDAGGEWISANDCLGLAFEHLVSNRGLKGKVARSLMTSHFVDAVAKSHGLETRETPVGFKFIGELLRTGQFLLGGEESGGLSIRGHVPEKDGVLACLLMLELVAMERAPLVKIRERLFKKLGAFHNSRINVRLERGRQVIELEERLRVHPPLDLAGVSVWRIDQSDGFKFILRDGSWLGLRSSGTEPVFRLYAEGPSPQRLDALLTAGRRFLEGKR